MNQIQVDKVVMPNNLKVRLMVVEQQQCASDGCTEKFHGFDFSQSSFHMLQILSKNFTISPKEWVEHIKNN